MSIRITIAVGEAKTGLEAHDAIDDDSNPGKSIATLAGHIIIAQAVTEGFERITREMERQDTARTRRELSRHILEQEEKKKERNRHGNGS